ncbi:unnamed protein product [Dibothriocephalus latus]|uniref:Uncharacterized protein n=1 Tax=Dibothriocephalus latus TaxID=60516 RepID=A0A3P7LG16_DIBLA|nr:unnamed protein product [Dibothriocephalus latus]
MTCRFHRLALHVLTPVIRSSRVKQLLLNPLQNCATVFRLETVIAAELFPPSDPFSCDPAQVLQQRVANPPWVDQQRRPSSALYSICASAPSGVPCATTQVPTAKATSSMTPKGALLQLRRRCELGRANERYSALSESPSPPGTRSPSVSIPRYRAGESVVLCGPPCASQAGNAVVQRGFQKLAACFRGKLTRDMFLTEKVSTLIRTIKDTAKIALSLYLENAPDTAAGDPQEQPRTLPPAEAELEARLNVQLLAGRTSINLAEKFSRLAEEREHKDPTDKIIRFTTRFSPRSRGQEAIFGVRLAPCFPQKRPAHFYRRPQNCFVSPPAGPDIYLSALAL